MLSDQDKVISLENIFTSFQKRNDSALKLSLIIESEGH